MPDDGKQLTRRRLLGSVATVAGASAAAGAGTAAYFTDAESSTNNFVQSGTLDLTFDQSETVPFLNVTDISPPDDDSETLQLINDGSLDGTLSIDISGITSTDSNGGSPGELDDYLEIEARVDGQTYLPRQVVPDPANTPIPVVEAQDNVVIAGETRTPFTLKWWLPEESTKNKAQGDSVSLEFRFTLVQT